MDHSQIHSASIYLSPLNALTWRSRDPTGSSSGFNQWTATTPHAAEGPDRGAGEHLPQLAAAAAAAADALRHPRAARSPEHGACSHACSPACCTRLLYPPRQHLGTTLTPIAAPPWHPARYPRTPLLPQDDMGPMPPTADEVRPSQHPHTRHPHTTHTHTTPSSQPPPAARAAVQRLQDHAYHAHQTLSVAPSLATIFEPPLPDFRRSLSRCPCSSRGRRTRCRPRGGRRGPWRARPTAAWSTCRARAASDTTTT